MEQNTTSVHDDLKAVKGPKALFWFLVLFFTLGTLAIATGGLWFQFINNWFPQEVAYGYVAQSFSQSALKMQIASLIVAVPVFFFISWLIRKAFKSGQLSAGNKVRTWISYIILFLLVATAIGDLITTIFTLLNGDFTSRFLLKALTILVIVAWIFIYYFMELRSIDALVSKKIPAVFAYVSLAFIIASLIGSFFIIQSPATARKVAFDQTRANDLSQIKYAIDSYYNEYQKLPNSLTDLKTNNSYLKIVDPKSTQGYEYAIKSTTAYQLCATFETSNKETAGKDRYNYGEEGYWHEAGRVCFDRQVPETMKGNINATSELDAVPLVR